MFGLNTSAFTGSLFNLLTTALFWIIAGAVLVIIVFGFLFFRKRGKLRTPVIELVSLGRGKLGMKTGLKGGWFKHRSTFFGLWDYGQEEVFKLKDNRVILNLSSEDYHEINGKMGVIIQRSPEDPRIVVPISKAKMENGELLEKIAPADYRGVVVDIIKKAEKETQDKVDKIMQWVFWGGIIIFSFISIMIIVQMVNHGQTEAKDLILQAGNMRQEQLETICRGIKYVGDSVVSSTAP